MRTARANRLARRAFGGGPRARRAWRILSTAAQRHDEVAVAALREAWLRDPRDDTWQDMRRWYSLAEVLVAAVSPDRSAGSRAALGAFCPRHEYLPVNDVARAVFFVLTGHHERYEALDPDGTLLAAGYRGASGTTRAALRHVMVALGHGAVVYRRGPVTEALDLVRAGIEFRFGADVALGTWVVGGADVIALGGG